MIDRKVSTGTSLAVIRFESREGIDRRYRRRGIRIQVTEHLLRPTLSPLELAAQFVPEKAGTVRLCPAAAPATGILSGSSDGMVWLWYVRTAKEVRCFRGHHQGVYGVAFKPDGNWILSGGYDNTIRFWDAQRGKELHRFKGPTHWVIGVAFCPDGRRVLSGSADKTVRLWRLPK